MPVRQGLKVKGRLTNQPIAVEVGLSLAQVALALLLCEANVASAIIGASRPEQVVDNAKASGATLAPQLFARAESILAGAMASA